MRMLARRGKERAGEPLREKHSRPVNPRTFSTDFAILAPGNAATYKVFVMPATGNERGSNAVTVTRPA